MQSGNTKTMIFGVAALVSYVSRIMTLLPGDIITTGTPPGVGMGKKPVPVYLKPGDVMTLGMKGSANSDSSCVHGAACKRDTNPDYAWEVGESSTPEQNCIVFRSKTASIMPTRMASSMGSSRGRQAWVGSSDDGSALLRRERRLL